MTDQIRIGSLFSGAGALDLAVEAVFGGRTVWHCEFNPAASKVLANHWPDVPNLGDITQVDWTKVDPVDVICGGFPCVDVSVSGKRAGMYNTRSGLWSYMRDAIDILRPKYVVIENVRGLLSANANRPMESETNAVGENKPQPILRAAGAVLGDLAEIGVYDARWITVRASDVGAPHRRERVFILATNTTILGQQEKLLESAQTIRGSVVSGDELLTLLPTHTSRDHKGRNQRGDETCLTGALKQDNPIGESIELLGTPQSRDHHGLPGRGFNTGNLCNSIDELHISSLSGWFGKYEPAIRRWETITQTPVPAPTEPNRNGNPRLKPQFSEWLMGWPAGWVTNIPGLSRKDQFQIIGNGVVTQQAYAALVRLLSLER